MDVKSDYDLIVIIINLFIVQYPIEFSGLYKVKTQYKHICKKHHHKRNHKNSTINEHSEKDKVSQETHEYAKDHSYQIQQLINQRVSCRGVFSDFS